MLEYSNYNILQYITLEIKFQSFGENHTEEIAYIYRETIKQLKEIEKEDILIHLGKDSSIYNHEVDYILCNSTNTKLDYPQIKLFYKDKELILPDISLMIKVKYPKYYFNCEDTSYLGITKEREYYPPCNLKDLKIEFVGDLYYFDINRPHKKFNLLEVSNQD